MIQSPVFNPFALLMDPASVLRAVECSPGLCSLQTRVFRPLDRKGHTSAADAELAAYDAEVDSVEGVEPASLELPEADFSDAHLGDDDVFRRFL